jgi:hypothetical protein
LANSEPNSLREALAHGPAESAHPDADLLNGFAERTLPLREQNAVMAHLACCAECRRIASLASDSAPQEPAKAEVILISRTRRSIRAWLPVAAAAAGIAITSALAFHSMKSAASGSTSSARQGPPTIALQQAEPQVPNPPGNAPSAATASSSTSAFALADASAVASGVRPHWRINSHGQLERSLGSGPWNVVLGEEGKSIRVLSVYGEQVWAGSTGNQVYRSMNNGRAWTAIVLPEKNGAGHAIAHIRLESPRDIRIEATDGTGWTSLDGGATWR